MLLITDTSHWKGRVDFQELKRNGIKANIAKATEGDSFLDDQFYNAKIDMEEVDLLWGAYHYFRYQFDPIRQAIHFYNVAKNTQLPPIIDVEKINNLGASKTVFTNKLKIMVDKTTELFGRKPWIYTGYYTWIELTTCPIWAKEHDLWLARYSINSPSILQIPPPWDKYVLWQYTDRERIGIVYPIDSNKFFGTEDELYSYSNAVKPLSLEDRIKELEDLIVKPGDNIQYIDLGNGYAKVVKIGD